MQIVIDSVETRTSEAKGDYAYGKGTISGKRGTRQMTFMSFGAQFQGLKDKLVAGATLNVNAVFNGGTIKLLSERPVAEEAQAA